MLPKVMMICMDCGEERIREKIREADYANLEIESVCWETEGLKKILQIILRTECPYICFGENDMESNPKKIVRMVEYLEKECDCDAVFCLNRYKDEKGSMARHISDGWMRYIEGKNKFDALLLFNLTIHWEENMVGNLESYMFRREAYINKAFLLDGVRIKKTEEKMLFMLENIYGMKTGIIKEILVDCKEKPLDAAALYYQYWEYRDLRNRILDSIGKPDYPDRELPSVFMKMIKKDFDRRLLVSDTKKEITIFYTDTQEYKNLEPIGKEAARRGYQVEFTDELEKGAEIGIYCSHVGVIKNIIRDRGGSLAKFSVILLHDLTQGESYWPDLWNYEPWNDFDIGILPGKDWVERWRRCSGFYYAHPRLGVYELGYPKGDYVICREFLQYAKEFKEHMGLKYPYSVLYAPSWENDGKEDDFIKAVQGLSVNLLIKQAAWNEWYPDIIRNIREMRQLHEGKYDNVYYIEPEEDIFTALGICDLVVSDESSVMTEALLFGKPSIAVMDWIIPEEKPRYSNVPVDYVYKCNKAQLRECVERVVEKIKAGEKTDRAEDVFSNIGRSAGDIMDLIEYYIGKKEECRCLDKEIYPIHMMHGLWDV